MYLVVWLDGTQVRVCGPLLRRLNAALSVLNSYRREDAPGLVFGGDEVRLRGFCEELADQQFGTTVPDILRQLCGLARDHRISVVRPTTAAVTTSPKPKAYPKHISPAGKKIWDEMLKQHGPMIRRKYPNKERQWAAALILYERFAAEVGVQPFRPIKSTEQKLRQASRDDVRKKVQMGGMRAGAALDRFIAAVQPMVARIKDEKFYEAVREREAFFLTTVYPLILKRNTNPVDVINHAIEQGWAGVQGRYVQQPIDRITHLLIEPNGKQLSAYVAAMLSRDQVILIFEFPDDASDAELVKGLEKAGRQWIRSGRIAWTAR